MKILSVLVAVTWLSAAFGSLSRASDFNLLNTVVGLCAVVGEPLKFSGQIIQLKAVYKLTAHGAVLVGDELCPSAFVVWRQTADYSESSEGAFVLSHVALSNGKLLADVVFRGKLRIVEEGFECSATTYCSRLVFETSALTSARLRQ